jgi:hypothetical protein
MQEHWPQLGLAYHEPLRRNATERPLYTPLYIERQKTQTIRMLRAALQAGRRGRRQQHLVVWMLSFDSRQNRE